MFQKISDLSFYVSKFDNKVLTIRDIFGETKISLNFSNLVSVDSKFIENIGLKFKTKTEEKIFIKKLRTFFYKSKISYSINNIDVKNFASYYRKYIKDKINQMYNFEFLNFYIVKCGTKEVKLLKNINTDLPFYRKKIKIFGLPGDYILAYNYNGIIKDLLLYKKEEIKIITNRYGDFFLPSLEFGTNKIFITSISKDKSFSTEEKSFQYAKGYLDFVFDYFSKENQDLKW